MSKEKDNIQKHEKDIPETNRKNYFTETTFHEEVEKENCTENKYVCDFTGSGDTKKIIHLIDDMHKKERSD